jgi:protein SCO1/2
MRGWIMLTLSRPTLPDAALPFLLEDLDTGVDPYLVATAASALRSYPAPSAAFAPFIVRAITNIRYRDERVSLETYGASRNRHNRNHTRSRTSCDLSLAWPHTHAPSSRKSNRYTRSNSAH